MNLNYQHSLDNQILSQANNEMMLAQKQLQDWRNRRNRSVTPLSNKENISVIYQDTAHFMNTPKTNDSTNVSNRQQIENSFVSKQEHHRIVQAIEEQCNKRILQEISSNQDWLNAKTLEIEKKFDYEYSLQLQKLQDKLDQNYQKQSTINQLQNQIQQIETKFKESEEIRLYEGQKYEERVKELHKEVYRLTEVEILNMKNQNESLQEQIDQKQSKIDALSQKNELQQKVIERETQKNKELENKLSKAIELNNQLAEQSKQLKLSNEKQTKNYNALKDKFRQVKEDYKYYQNQSQSYIEQIESYQNNEQKIEDIASQLKKYKQNISQLQNKLSQQKALNKQLEYKLQEQTQNAQIAVQKLHEEQENYLQLHDEYNKMIDDVSCIRSCTREEVSQEYESQILLLQDYNERLRKEILNMGEAPSQECESKWKERTDQLINKYFIAVQRLKNDMQNLKADAYQKQNDIKIQTMRQIKELNSQHYKQMQAAQLKIKKLERRLATTNSRR